MQDALNVDVTEAQTINGVTVSLNAAGCPVVAVVETPY